MLSRWQNPRTALRWLGMFRLGLVVLTSIAMGLQWSVGHGPPLVPTLALAAAVVVAQVLERRWVALHEPQQWIVDVHTVLDLVFWSSAVVLKRAADHPSLDTLLLFVIPSAFALPGPRAWGVATLVCALHNGLVLWGPRHEPPSVLPADLELVRTVEHLLIFDTAVIAVAGFVIGIRGVLREREAILQSALDERNRDDRLVALGTMAAGIAHELGTPLSSIDLLANEAAAVPAEAPELLRTIRGQVQRCREILDRIRGATSRTVSPEVEGLGTHLRQWVADWQRAGTDRQELTLELDAAVDNASVRGDADTWRGIVWSLLDNALRAGAPVLLRARLEGRVVVVEIDDSGAGPTPEVLARAGDPFFTHWTDGAGPGRGLGLFVARRFAHRVGGDVRLSRRIVGGGRVTLHLATLLTRQD